MVKKADCANDSSNSSSTSSSSLSSSSLSNSYLKLANKKQKLYDSHLQHHNPSLLVSQNNQQPYTTLNSNNQSTTLDNKNNNNNVNSTSLLPLYHPPAKSLNNYSNMQNLTTMTNVAKLTGSQGASNNSNLNSLSMDVKCIPNINDPLAGAQAYFRNSTELNAAVHIINSVQQHHNSSMHGSKGNSLKDRNELMSSRSSSNILNCSSSSSNSGSEMPSGSGMGGLHGSNGGGGEETVKKREIRLLKNREAARECRRKKKEYIKCLENRVSVLETQNKALIDELKALKELYCQTGDPLQKH